MLQDLNMTPAGLQGEQADGSSLDWKKDTLKAGGEIAIREWGSAGWQSQTSLRRLPLTRNEALLILWHFGMLDEKTMKLDPATKSGALALHIIDDDKSSFDATLECDATSCGMQFDQATE